VSRFVLPASCPQCSGALTLVNSTSSGLLSVAILECEPCSRQWEITVRVTVHRTPEQIQNTEKRAVQRARTRASASVGA
jgi:Zn ribbon nucleic-acid-binding protein